MINKGGFGIDWREDMEAEKAELLASLIVNAMDDALPEPVNGQKRLYIFVFTPPPYPCGEAVFLAAARQKAASDAMRVLALPHAGRSYSVFSADLFCTLIPLAFALGPPELTLVAANCDIKTLSSEQSAAELVSQILSVNQSRTGRNHVGMHFDSGVLVEKF